MNRYLVLISVFLAVAACKTQRTVAPIILKDSVSITYKQGTIQPLSIYKTEEQPTPTGVRGAAIESRKNSSVPADGTVGLGATREASVFEGLLSQRTNKKAVPPTPIIRVDTVFIERWHTEIVESQKKKVESAKPDKPIPRFYKDCTKGFWILLILLLGRIAFRIIKAIYLRR